VVIQTHHPDHPLYADLFSAGYERFAQRLANERELAQMPPFSYLAVIRAEAIDAAVAEQFLQGLKLPLRAAIENTSRDSMAQVMGPLPAIIERVNRRFRLFLQIKCEQRALLHHLLNIATQAAYSQRLPNGLRWSLDIDPIEMP
jgi:primosomal protein N' (replication factor Y)